MSRSRIAGRGPDHTVPGATFRRCVSCTGSTCDRLLRDVHHITLRDAAGSRTALALTRTTEVLYGTDDACLQRLCRREPAPWPSTRTPHPGAGCLPELRLQNRQLRP